jgi:lambda family phage portal protein
MMKLPSWIRGKSEPTTIPLGELIPFLKKNLRPTRVTPVMDSRNFEAAEEDQLVANWTGATVPINTLLETSLPKLRSRSREQCINNDYAKRYLHLVKSNVIGPQGVKLQAEVKTPDGKADRETNTGIEAAWADWGKPGSCDVTGTLSWVDMQNIVIESVARDGESFTRIHPGKQFKYGMALQTVESERVPIALNNDLANGNKIRMGIEFNQYQKPVAYYLSMGIQDSHSPYNPVQEYQRVPADQIIHLFRRERPEQMRGIPWLASCLWRLKQLHGYEHAAVVAARAGAAKMGFITTTGDMTFQGEDPEAATNGVSMDADPGTIEELEAGKTFTAWDPTYPHGEFADFRKAMLQGAASGGNVNYISLGNDLEGVSYSSIRAGVLEDRESWKANQTWFIQGFCHPAYNAWIWPASLTGLITGKGGQPISAGDPAVYVSPRWQPRRWAWVDPLKDAAANQKAVDNKIRSRSAIIRETGDDPTEVWEEIASENTAMEEIGVSAGPEPTGTPPNVTVTNNSKTLEKTTGDRGGVLLSTRMDRMNERAMGYAVARIKLGFFDDGDEWAFNQDDLAAIHADRPGRCFLQEEPDMGDGGYRLPTGKFIGGEYTIFRAALEAAKSSTDLEPVISAANALMAAIESGVDVTPGAADVDEVIEEVTGQVADADPQAGGGKGPIPVDGTPPPQPSKG